MTKSKMVKKLTKKEKNSLVLKYRITESEFVN